MTNRLRPLSPTRRHVRRGQDGLAPVARHLPHPVRVRPVDPTPCVVTPAGSVYALSAAQLLTPSVVVLRPGMCALTVVRFPEV